MTPYVITAIGDAETRPLEPNHIECLRQNLDISAKEDWLAQHEACDLFFESPKTAGTLSEHARKALSGTEIDVVCGPAAGRRKKLLISDMDSTVIDQECIDEMGDAYGVGPQIREITEASIKGKISFSDALRQRMVLMKGLDHALMENVYAERISLKPGARTLVQTMRQHGAYCILVSGGFDYFAQRIAARAGFHDSLANILVFENGRLTGKVVEPILGRTAKLDALNRLCEQKNLTPCEVLAVGDGANDIKMIEVAGMGVAFHGAEAVQKSTNVRINHGTLAALLYLQGYRKAQFIAI